MKSSHSRKQDTATSKINTSSATALIEQGLIHVQQGYHAEAIALFKQAHDLLLPHERQLAAALEALSTAITEYLQAQFTILAASKRLVASEHEQQVKIMALKTLLSTSQEQQDTTELERHISSSPESKNEQEFPPLYVRCFGRFEVRRVSTDGEVVQLCSNLKGQAILRYLLNQPVRRETMDKLIAVFWSDEVPDVAHHKLRVSVSALRRSLNNGITNTSGGGYILCKGQIYELNQTVPIRSDVDDFISLYRAGQQTTDEAMLKFYEQACRLYTGPFLIEDLYLDWSFIRREELNKMYVVMCNKLAEYNIQHRRYEDAVMWATAMLKVSRCDEEAHRLIMRAYIADGRRSEAVRQYELCQRVLLEELGVQPMVETQNIFYTDLIDAVPSLIRTSNYYSDPL